MYLKVKIQFENVLAETEISRITGRHHPYVFGHEFSNLVMLVVRIIGKTQRERNSALAFEIRAAEQL